MSDASRITSSGNPILRAISMAKEFSSISQSTTETVDASRGRRA